MIFCTGKAQSQRRAAVDRDGQEQRPLSPLSPSASVSASASRPQTAASGLAANGIGAAATSLQFEAEKQRIQQLLAEYVCVCVIVVCVSMC